MMRSPDVDSAATGAGIGIKSSEYSDGENSSYSGEELEHHDEVDIAPGSVIDTPSCKRPFQDSQSETDQSQAKKRRKQSKPVRVFSLTEPSSDDEPEIRNEGKVHNKGSPNSAYGHKDAKLQMDHKEEGELEPNKESEPVSLYDKECSSQCPYCPEVLNPQERLKFHIENGHFQSQLQQKVGHDNLVSNKTVIPLNLSHLPKTHATSPVDFVVGSLLSEFRNKSDDKIHGTKPPLVLSQALESGNTVPPVEEKISLPAYMPLAPHFLLPLVAQNSMMNASPSIAQSQVQVPGTTPVRIFNPDAYCELCNKEFCNKYFLKTHKANKHGIYVDSTSTTGGSATISGHPYPAPLIQVNLNLPRMASPVPGTQTPKPPSIPPKITDAMNVNKIPGNGQLKAFCDICQKKFCNKYFVRRHKAKIHGIVDDSLPPSSSTSFLNLPDCIRKQEIDERGSISAGSDTGSNVLETVSSDMPENISELEEIGVSFREKPESNLQIKYSPDNSVTDEGAEASNLKQEPEQDSEEGRFIGDFVENSSGKSIKNSPTSPQQNPQEIAISSERLRKLGVINADAFCEICCKEYCNKYFLRTHKMKRHGIYITDCEGKELKTGGSGCVPWNHHQTSPLNLIVGEQGTNSSDSGEKVRNDFSDSDDPECDICGRRFQSFYLMQVHRAYLHVMGNERQEGQEDSGGLEIETQKDIATNCNGGKLSQIRDKSTVEVGPFNNNNDGNSNGGRDAISEDLQKLQTMILQLNNLNVSKVRTCTICNKVSENHYCLTAHMMAEHGVLMEDQSGVEEQKLPSSDITDLPPLIDTHTYCFLCKKDFFTQYQLKQHVDDFHNCNVKTTATTNVMASNTIKEELDAKCPPEKNQSQQVIHVGPEKRISVTPTSSYCEICNKELCNKYFMKTHMQRMHGIEIENGAQIGGVICDICNKELCSKYFLRVHKQNTHGIIEDGSATHSARDNTNGHNMQIHLEGDQALKPSELSDLSHRYFSHFTEVCSICNRRFRSTKWLKAHLLNDHGENGIEKWKELESQYHLVSQQGKHQLQISRGSGVVSHSSSGSGSTYSPTLKIPNNWNNQDQDTSCPRTPALMPLEGTGEGSGQQVFASLFGSGDSTVKNYHCSYCPFTTPILAFLFVHERSHAGLSSLPLPNPSKPFQCPVCLQSFLQSDVFQHHILTHQFSGVLNPFIVSSSSAPYLPQIGNIQERKKSLEQHSPNNEEKGDNMKNENLEYEVIEEDSINAAGGKYKFRCSRCFQRFRSRENCLAHIQNRHILNSTSPAETIASSSFETIAIKMTPQGLYKCTRCGFSSVHMVIVKKHMRREHVIDKGHFELRQEPEAAESLLELKEAAPDEVRLKLQEAASKSQVPASYAVPQNQPPFLDQFIMQPFLLEEPNGTPSSEQVQLHRKFVPSLVFLPVKEKLSEPLTVSFTLTPA